MTRRTGRRRSPGQNLVEFALVGPIFFLLIFGIIEGGRLVWTHHTLNNAVKDGTRYALVRGTNSDLPDAPATNAKVKDYMIDHSTGLDKTQLTVRLLTPDHNMENKSRLRVEAEYRHDLIVSYIFGRGSLTLRASSQAIFSK